MAISCPLLEDSRIRGSRGVLINITGSSRLGLHEVNEACSIIREAAACDDVQINFGVILNESLGESVKITVIATGFQPESHPAPLRRGVPVQESRPSLPPPPPVMEEEMPQAEYVPAPPTRPTPPQAAVFEADDLDTPAYLRQGKLLN